MLRRVKRAMTRSGDAPAKSFDLFDPGELSPHVPASVFGAKTAHDDLCLLSELSSDLARHGRVFLETLRKLTLAMDDFAERVPPAAAIIGDKSAMKSTAAVVCESLSYFVDSRVAALHAAVADARMPLLALRDGSLHRLNQACARLKAARAELQEAKVHMPFFV